MKGKRESVVALTVSILLCVFGNARSQVAASAIALQIQPSARAAGMGLASNAVFWGDYPDYWANPATLGYHSGVRFEHGRSQLVPDFFDDVYFTTDRIRIGAYGLGIALVGEPFDWLGETKLDYGEIPIVIDGPEGGIEIARHSPYEEVTSLSIGANVLEVSDNVLVAMGAGRHNLSRFGDVSVGYAHKDYRADLAPPIDDPRIDLPEGAKADATMYDRGALIRVTPYNSMDYRGYFPWFDSMLEPILGGFRFDVSYGSSLQNYNSPALVYVEGREPSPVAKVARDGWALHAAIGLPAGLRSFLDDLRLGILAESLTPLLSWGKGWDRLNPSIRVDGRVTSTPELEHSGWELDVAGVFSVRRGRIDEPDAHIHGDTSGWGVGFSLADIGGFRYDHATVPQSSVLSDVERKGYMFFVDPVALWRVLDSGLSSGVATDGR